MFEVVEPELEFAIIWNCAEPPLMLGGHVEPVLESVPVTLCQQPLL